MYGTTTNRSLPAPDYLRVHLPEVQCFLVVIGAVLIPKYPLLDVPQTLWVDDAWFALRARDVVRGTDSVPLERPGPGVGGAPMQVCPAAVVQVRGIPVPYSVRIASSVTGIATVVVLYPMLADVWWTEFGKRKPRWMALIGTVVLAGMFSHLSVSRLGNQNALSVVFRIVTVWGMWLALDRLSTQRALAGDLTLGLSKCTHESCRALPILIISVIILRLDQAPGGGRRYSHHVIPTAPRRHRICAIG